MLEFLWQADTGASRDARLKELLAAGFSRTHVLKFFFRTADSAVADVLPKAAFCDEAARAYAEMLTQKSSSDSPTVRAAAAVQAMHRGMSLASCVDGHNDLAQLMLRRGGIEEIKLALTTSPAVHVLSVALRQILHTLRSGPHDGGELPPPDSMDSLQVLLEHGARVTEERELHEVAAVTNERAIRLFINAHAWPVQNPAWYTLLKCALARPGAPQVPVILDAGGSLEPWISGARGGLLLAAAVEGKNHEWVAKLLAAGAPVDRCPPAAKTSEPFEGGLLYQAVRTSTLDVVRALLDGGVSANEVGNHYEQTALFGAESVEMARLLLERGADPNARMPQNGLSVLGHWLAHRKPPLLLELMTLAVAHGADLNAAHPQTGVAVLHAAATNADPTVISWLLDHGANPNAVTLKGLRPLDVLVSHRQSGKNAAEAERRLAEVTAPQPAPAVKEAEAPRKRNGARRASP